jgi:hypothetical protein
VGDYSDPDRGLWLAVNVGVASLVELALAKGGDASKKFQVKNDRGAVVTVDLLLLCWMKMAANRATLRSSLAEAGLSVCDPIARWDLSPDDELETYDQDGSVICEETMDGNAVARLLIPAGTDPFLRLDGKWVAAEHVEEWRALARHGHLDEALPSTTTVEPRTRARF